MLPRLTVDALLRYLVPQYGHWTLQHQGGRYTLVFFSRRRGRKGGSGLGGKRRGRKTERNFLVDSGPKKGGQKKKKKKPAEVECRRERELRFSDLPDGKLIPGGAQQGCRRRLYSQGTESLVSVPETATGSLCSTPDLFWDDYDVSHTNIDNEQGRLPTCKSALFKAYS